MQDILRQKKGVGMDEILSVKREDLEMLASYACEHKRFWQPICDECDTERGGCCNGGERYPTLPRKA